MKRETRYSWDEINQALMGVGFGAKIILKVLFRLVKNRRQK